MSVKELENCYKSDIVCIMSADQCWCRVGVGEINELKAELNNEKKEKKKEAVKKVIASMTVGKDVR